VNEEGSGVAARLGAWGEESKALFAQAREPERMTTAVITLHRRVDEALAATIAGHEVHIACSRGCAFCCSLRVQVQPYEAFRLAAWLRRNFDAARLGRVIARLRANVEKTRALGEEGRKRTNVPCSLLGDDGACTAYEGRTFESVDPQECGLTPNGPAMCKWRLSFDPIDPQRTRFSWQHSDAGESGAVRCTGRQITTDGIGNVHTGSFDTTTGRLTWERLPYVVTSS